MKPKKQHFHVASLAMVFVLAGILVESCSSATPPSAPTSTNWDEIEAGFQNPPATAKTRVWWHWMNGNVSKEGIKADLTWMDSIGIGQFQNISGSGGWGV